MSQIHFTTSKGQFMAVSGLFTGITAMEYYSIQKFRYDDEIRGSFEEINYLSQLTEKEAELIIGQNLVLNKVSLSFMETLDYLFLTPLGITTDREWLILKVKNAKI